MRNRRQKRAVGLDRAADRAAPCCATSFSSSARGNVTMPGQRDVESDVQGAPRHRAVAGETVKHAADVTAPAPRPECGTCRPRPRACESRSAAAVAAPAGSAHETPAAGRRAARSRSGSPDRSRRRPARAAARRCALDRLRRSLGRIGRRTSRRVRMDADREADLSPRARRRSPPARSSASSSAARMTRARSSASRLGACDDVIEIARRTPARRCGSGSRPCNRILTAHSRRRGRQADGSTATRVGRPPSVLAASTIPFDSMPISFAGFRLATMTIVRPTSCSG